MGPSDGRGGAGAGTSAGAAGMGTRGDGSVGAAAQRSGARGPRRGGTHRQGRFAPRPFGHHRAREWIRERTRYAGPQEAEDFDIWRAMKIKFGVSRRYSPSTGRL